MGRNHKRESGVKARQAIKEGSHVSRSKKHAVSENYGSTQPGLKRSSSPGSSLAPNPKRNALGDVTNNVPIVGPTGSKPVKQVSVTSQGSHPGVTTRAAAKRGSSKEPKRPTVAASSSLDDSMGETTQASSTSEDTPVTAMQNFLQATTLSDDSLRSDESLTESAPFLPPPSPSSQPQLWRDIDQAEAHDHLFSAEYAPEIFVYMRKREEHFSVSPYMSSQPDITHSMRTILVDWLIEVQENFELFHETLYMAVKLVDLYLSRKMVKREFLQLVGATSMLIASKFEELSPPLVDDFIYLCDDAYTIEDLLRMERDILKTLNYDINVPVAYRFLRRLAKAAEANMEIHTLARYISESTLQEYQFVDVKPSLMAAAAMYLALRMRHVGAWTPTLQHYSGYTVEEILPLVERLNSLIQTPLGQTTTVRSKYSHEVFFKVALTPPLPDVQEDARQALEECPTITAA